jgi:hypothetical protein
MFASTMLNDIRIGSLDNSSPLCFWAAHKYSIREMTKLRHLADLS